MGRFDRKKKKKDKRQKQPSPQPPQQRTPAPPQQKTPERGRLLKFLTGAGAVIGIAGGLGIAWERYARSEPEIHPLGMDLSAPFYLPFAVKNPSAVYTMYDVSWKCTVGRVLVYDGKKTVLLGNASFQLEPVSTIKPNKTVNFRCAIERIAAPLEMYSTRNVRIANVTLTAKFRTAFIFGMARIDREVSIPMYWMPDSNPPRWVEGPFAPVKE
jgi:hypothetical protein